LLTLLILALRSFWAIALVGLQDKGIGGGNYSYLSELYREFWIKAKARSNQGSEDAEIKAEEVCPDKLIQGLVYTKSVNKAVEMLKQAHLALFDLAIHTPSSHNAAREMNISKVWNDMRDEIVASASSDSDYGGDLRFGQAGFPHIFRKYDAGYFAYPL
jgi:metallopeptidase MepB